HAVALVQAVVVELHRFTKSICSPRPVFSVSTATSVANYPDLKRRLSILSVLIFDSSVDAGTPSRVAAPKGPDTRPLLSLRAVSMASLLWATSVPLVRVGTGGLTGARPESQRGSIDSRSESHRITERSTTFCSSRILPGQSYD